MQYQANIVLPQLATAIQATQYQVNIVLQLEAAILLLSIIQLLLLAVHKAQTHTAVPQESPGRLTVQRERHLWEF
jgi:hypothetical protein